MNNLYASLITLCDGEKSPFYFKDFELEGKTYRIFSYHAAIPRDFMSEEALEARGIMFEMNDACPVRIAARPMHKFFNRGEHPEYDLRSLDAADIYEVYEKADGSLMSSYMHGDELRLKSKASLFSDHAIAAMRWLDNEDGILRSCIEDLEADGYTVNMEWVSPDPKFRIVVHYNTSGLIVLNARHRDTGEYLDRIELEQLFGQHAYRYLVPECHPSTVVNFERNYGSEFIEGIVVIGNEGDWIKMKTQWYLDRHRAKDFLNRPAAFVEMVIKEEVDDVLQLLDQEGTRQQADEWAYAVTRTMNGIVNRVTRYYLENKQLSRKEFAIKAQSVMNKHEFALAMMYYTKEDEPDWKAYFLKGVKRIDWGISLEETKEVA